MEALLESLRRWPGRQATKRKMEERGFYLPTRYEKTVFEIVGEDKRQQFEHYWDEVAMEYICSAGRADPVRRSFRKIEPTDRSAYLDELANVEENAAAGAEGLSLDPDLRNYEKQMQVLLNDGSGNTRNYNLFLRMEREKAEDIRRLSISVTDWPNKCIAAYEPWYKKFGNECGFKRSRRWWRKSYCDGDLEFRFKIDGGMRLTWETESCFKSEIHHTDDSTLIFYTDDFWLLTPGISFYNINRSPETGVLGAAAYINTLDCIGVLIEES